MARVASSSSWADIIDDDSNSLGALGNPADFLLRSKSAPSTTTTTTAASSSSSFDPELDCSRDGLNLAFSKGLTTTPVKAADGTSPAGVFARSSSAGNSSNSSSFASPKLGWSKAASSPSTSSSSPSSSPSPQMFRVQQHNKIVSGKRVTISGRLEEAIVESEKEGTASPEVGQKRGEEQARTTNFDTKRARTNEEGLASVSSRETPKKQDGEDEEDDEEEGGVESDPVRLAWRAKQIAYGKNDESYKQYIKQIPKASRRHYHPATPDIHRKCSKRAFGGLISAWRRSLHEFDSLSNRLYAAGAASSSPSAGIDGNWRQGLTDNLLQSSEKEQLEVAASSS